MAVIEDDASAAAVVGEPGMSAALVPIDAVSVDLGGGLAVEAAQGAVGGARQAGWSSAVVIDPVSDGIPGDLRPVVGLAQATADFDGIGVQVIVPSCVRENVSSHAS